MRIAALNKLTLDGDWYVLLTPYLFALYSCLTFYTFIMRDVPFSQVYFTLGTTFLLTSFLLIFFKWMTKNLPRASLVASIIVLLSLSYGQIYRGLQQPGNSGNAIADHQLLGPGVLALLSVFIFSVIKTRPQVTRFVSKYLLFVAVAAAILPIKDILLFSIARLNDPLRNWDSTPKAALKLPQAIEPGLTSPDIYYIILDSYARSDVLLREYNYDNSEFLGFLESRGFYVAGQSRSNYLHTAVSLATSLNLAYPESLIRIGRSSQIRQPLKDLIQNSQLRQILAEEGYKYVAFDTGYIYTEAQDADVYYEPFMRTNEYEEIVLSLSAAIVADDWAENPLPYLSYSTHRERILYTLEKLKETASIPGPKLVFAHIMLPHPPFVFDPDGQTIEPDRPYEMHDADMFLGTREEYRRDYAGQVEFTNRQIQAVIDHLLNTSPSPPVIVLQGDHGPRMLINWSSLEESCMLESSAILNAIYLPGRDSDNLYPSMTPVNTFRVILNEYFDARLDMLKDRTYFSNLARRLDVTDVTSQAQVYCSQSQLIQIQPIQEE